MTKALKRSGAADNVIIEEDGIYLLQNRDLH